MEITHLPQTTDMIFIESLSRDTITRLMQQVTGLCDTLQPYGLVDYEIGLWEEQIVRVFTACLDVLQSPRYYPVCEKSGTSSTLRKECFLFGEEVVL